MGTDKPHVIFIVLDACGFGHTSLSGYFRDTTPFLSEFAKESVHHPLSFVQGPISGLSVASFTTATHAFDHKDCPIEITTTRPSLAMRLHDDGYHTALITSNPYYASKLGHQQGVDHYRMFFDEGEEMGRIMERGFIHRVFKFLNRLSIYRSSKEFFKKYMHSAYSAGRMHKTILTTRKSPYGDASMANKEIFELLENRPKEKPLFLLVQYMDLHAPHLPPDKFLNKFGKNISKQDQYEYWHKRSMRPLPKFSTEEQEDLAALYDGCIAHIDSRIRDVIQQLKEQGMYDNSMIIVTADHGEAFFEHGDLGHHGLLYEENIRVPLLIKYPGGTWSGTEEGRVTSLVDIGPTIMETVGLLRPREFTGKNLRGDAEVTPWTFEDHSVAFVAFRFTPKDFTNLNFEDYTISVRTKNRKLIVRTGAKDELYFLDTDPKEKTNVLEGSQTSEMKNAHTALRDLLRQYIARIESADRHGQKPGEFNSSDEVKEYLP